jgi:hypothetical protein
MPISFRLEKDGGRLDWSHAGDGAVDLDNQQAMIVALAEIAEALREIALALQTANAEGNRIQDGPGNEF